MINLALDRLVFRGRFDDEVAVLHAVEVDRGFDPLQCGIGVRLRNAFARHLAAQIGADGLARLFELLGIDVLHDYVAAGERAHMRNAVTHLTGADDANFLDFHFIPANVRSLTNIAETLRSQ